MVQLDETVPLIPLVEAQHEAARIPSPPRTFAFLILHSPWHAYIHTYAALSRSHRRILVFARGYRGSAYQHYRTPGCGSGHLGSTLILILTLDKARLADRRRRENTDSRVSCFRVNFRRHEEYAVAARETVRGFISFSLFLI